MRRLAAARAREGAPECAPECAPESGAGATRGITLLELVIAVFVLALGTLAALRSVDHAQRSLAGEAPRLFAAQVALNRAEEWRLLGPEAARALPDRVAYGPHDWRIAVAETRTRAGFIEATITATGAGRPGGRAVAVIRPAPAPASAPAPADSGGGG